MKRMRRSPAGFSLVELMAVILVIFIIAMAAVPASTAFRSRVAVSSAVKTAEVIRSALYGYAASSGDVYPMTQDARTWPSFQSLCASHGASLAADPVAQGLSFFQYYGLDAGGGSCDNAALESACTDYVIIMRVLNVHGNVTGAQLEVGSRGILRQTY